MRILGVDPGTMTVGYGVVDVAGSKLHAVEYGVIRARRTLDVAQRLAIIQTGIEEVIHRLQPDVFAIEKVFAGKSFQSALRIGEGRGAALAAAAKAGLPVSNYTPAEVKKSVVGSGRAAKEQVGEMIRVILGLDSVPSPLDASDALAIAICHANRI